MPDIWRIGVPSLPLAEFGVAAPTKRRAQFLPDFLYPIDAGEGSSLLRPKESRSSSVPGLNSQGSAGRPVPRRAQFLTGGVPI